MTKTRTMSLAEVLEAEVKPYRITAQTKEVTVKMARRFRGGARISTGRFLTDEEHEARRARVLAEPLP